MLVEAAGKKMVADWKHEVKFDREKLMEEAKNDPKLLKILSLSEGRTICTIKEMDGDLKMEGISYRSKKDHFCKYTGRKESLKRALEANIPRKDRQIYWDTFLAMRKPKARVAQLAERNVANVEATGS